MQYAEFSVNKFAETDWEGFVTKYDCAATDVPVIPTVWYAKLQVGITVKTNYVETKNTPWLFIKVP